MKVLTHNAPLSIRQFRLPRLRLPKLGLTATIAAAPTGMTQAYSMAYVEPFKNRQRRPLVLSDADLEGRDPNW